MKKKKILFITNPFSGYKLGKDVASFISQNLDTERYEYTLEFTKYPGHATKLAHQAVKDNYQAVIAAGGDGTVNEVANALQGTQTALGIIPIGSGNGFAYHLGIKIDIEKAIQIINHGHIEKIDTGSVNGHFFVNIAGLGLDASVAFKTKKNKKRGFLPYLLQSISEGLKFKKLKLKIKTPEKSWSGNYTMATIANGSIYGYNFAIAPTAIVNDGLFDVLLIKNMSLWKYIFLLPSFLNKSIHKSKFVEYFKTNEIYIELQNEDFYHVDGEGFEVSGTLHFKIQPMNLYIITQAQNL